MSIEVHVSYGQDEWVGLERDRENLARLERDIIDGEKRVSEQALLVEGLVRSGQDTAMAQELLQAMQDTLRDWYAERELIRKLSGAETKSSQTPLAS